MEFYLSVRDPELCVLVPEAGDHCIFVMICFGVKLKAGLEEFIAAEIRFVYCGTE